MVSGQLWGESKRDKKKNKRDDEETGKEGAVMKMDSLFKPFPKQKEFIDATFSGEYK